MNIETRFANRSTSIFSAFGAMINDFYLEAGIYFVGGFNASLVAWDIYTSLLIDGQPLPYAIAVAIIAFIAVEGLAVYLVGAAAKTNNGLLWFFSVVFAAFFTYAHYQEMTVRAGIISQYITLAIPFFVVVGYWARTVKIDTENSRASQIEQAQIDAEYQRQIAARAAELKHEETLAGIEQARLNAEHQRKMDQRALDLKHEEQLAGIEAKASVPPTVRKTVREQSANKALETLKANIMAELRREKPNMTKLTEQLGIGRTTLYKHLRTLTEQGEVVKNGNGYEPV